MPDARVDFVVSFETIEHHDQHLQMMMEIRRVLRPDGVLIISSPDKHEYSDVPGFKNEFHVKELYLSEFVDLLSSHFSPRQRFRAAGLLRIAGGAHRRARHAFCDVTAAGIGAFGESPGL